LIFLRFRKEISGSGTTFDDLFLEKAPHESKFDNNRAPAEVQRLQSWLQCAR